MSNDGKSYIIYKNSPEWRNDIVVIASNIKEAKAIAKREYGEDAEVQEYSKEDQRLWG